MAETRHREVIRLAEVADRNSLIEDMEFDDCELLGPAIVAPLDHVEIDGASFDAPPDALLIEVAEDRLVVGVIGLRRVKIHNCRIRNVGIIGTPASIAEFRSGLES
jgi:hypothetical protein